LVERLVNNGIAPRQAAQPKTAVAIGEARLRARTEGGIGEHGASEKPRTNNGLALGVD
jgi:hypothetical protein